MKNDLQESIRGTSFRMPFSMTSSKLLLPPSDMMVPGAIESSEIITGADAESCASGVGCGFVAALKDVSMLSRENTYNFVFQLNSS